MKTSFKLFNFLGVPVKLNIFFIIIFFICPLNIAIAAFIAILIHEMAHCYIAHRRGYQLYGIEISFFGGAASMDSNMHERDSIPVTAAGPISNLILAIISFGVGLIFPSIFTNGSFLYSLVLVNFVLFAFNMLPIIPMDGGLILKDSLIRILKNRRKANRIALKTSLVTSILMLGASLYCSEWFIAIFACFFIYNSITKLKN